MPDTSKPKVCNCSCPPGTSYCQPTTNTGWYFATTPTYPLTEERLREIIREELSAAKEDPAAGKPWGPQKMGGSE